MNSDLPEFGEIEGLNSSGGAIETRLQSLEERFQAWSSGLENAVERIGRDAKLVAQLTQQTERRAYEVSTLQTEMETVRQEVAAVLRDVGGTEGLALLRQQHLSLLETLQEFQTGARYLDEIRGELAKAEARLDLVREWVEGLGDLVTTAQTELMKRAMALVDDVRHSASNGSSPAATTPSGNGSSTAAELQALQRELRSRLVAFDEMQRSVQQLRREVDSLRAAQAPGQATGLAAPSLAEESPEIPPEITFDAIAETTETPGIPAAAPGETAPEASDRGTLGELVDLDDNLEFSFTEEDIGNLPEPAPQATPVPQAPAEPEVPTLTLEQVRSEAYGLAQEARTERRQLKREQDQKIQTLERKLQTQQAWNVALAIGVVLSVGLHFVSLPKLVTLAGAMERAIAAIEQPSDNP